MQVAGLPEPCLVVLVGASGAGKSHWAASHFRDVEVVSSDALRAVVGSGRADLDASDDAFDLLQRIVTARTGRGLTTVVDTLGLDDDLRGRLRHRARDTGLASAVVVVEAPAEVCRRRNARRDRPVPADVLRSQLRRARDVAERVADEGWDHVLRVSGADATSEDAPSPVPASDPRGGIEGVVLQVSRFPWGEQPLSWLVDVARAAEQAGFAGIALMDHLVQIPQVGRAWDPMPDPLVTLGALAAATTHVHVGTLVSPMTIRAPGVLAKAMATLDVLSGGRAFCGVGAGWFEREHLVHDLPFPPIARRQDLLERGIEVMRALWAPGTGSFTGQHVELPETTSYPRPAHPIPVVVGGSGTRTLGIGARLGDAVNVRTEVLGDALPRLRAACDDAGRPMGTEVALTVLDTPVVGTDRDDLSRRIERLRGRTSAARFQATRAVGLVEDHRARLAAMGEQGVSTVFVAPPDLDGAADVERLAPLASVSLA